ncbi:MAG: RNase H-like domain-containing protein [Ignavibacteria bacterium]
MKKIMARDTLLAYPNFSKKFEIFTDASDQQLGAVITQEGRPIAYYSRKLNSSQLNYTTTEKELLAIVETLKEFRSILLGQEIVVYTDHKNLTYKVFNTQRVMRWRLLIEEYGPTLEYVKGVTNVVADALSRLDLTPSVATEADPSVADTPTRRNLAEAFALTKEDFSNTCPLTIKTLMREQQKDKKLLKRAEGSSVITLRSYHGGGKVRQLLVENDKIIVPTSLQKPIVEWYHNLLCHPGETRMENTVSQHLTWKGLRKTVHEVCTKCDVCQRTKRTKKKYGHLPAKEAEAMPWDKLCVDLIGPYTIYRKHKKSKPLTLWAVTMIDPATGWFEIASITTKRADVIANIIEQTWFTRYPWPSQVILDRGTEFMAEFTVMLENEYGVKKKPITKRNPQANSIVERVHQTLGNMIRTFSVQSMDEENPWDGILAAVAFAVRATVHTTNRATPAQLVFGRDAILQVQHIADWEYITKRKQQMINANNARENSARIPYEYRVGQRVLIKAEQGAKYGTDSYLGPFTVTAVHNNGTIRVNEGAVTDTYNIRNVTPYTE